MNEDGLAVPELCQTHAGGDPGREVGRLCAFLRLLGGHGLGGCLRRIGHRRGAGLPRRPAAQPDREDDTGRQRPLARRHRADHSPGEFDGLRRRRDAAGRLFAREPKPRANRRVEQRGGDGRAGGRRRHEGRDPGRRADDPAVRQAVAERLPRPGQPPPDRPDRAPKRPGHLLVTAAFQVRQHERDAVLLRQPVQLLVERGLHVVRGRRVGRVGAVARGLRLLRPAACGVRAGAAGQAERDRVQPVRDRAAAVERRSLVHQHEEGRLEGVLRGVRVGQDAAADPEHEPAVPPDEYLKRRLVAVIDEPRQELAVRCPVPVRVPDQAPDLAQLTAGVRVRHVRSPAVCFSRIVKARRKPAHRKSGRRPRLRCTLSG
jgi:hypothetical protein